MGPVNQPRPAALSDISEEAGKVPKQQTQMHEKREEKYQGKIE